MKNIIHLSNTKIFVELNNLFDEPTEMVKTYQDGPETIWECSNGFIVSFDPSLDYLMTWPINSCDRNESNCKHIPIPQPPLDESALLWMGDVVFWVDPCDDSLYEAKIDADEDDTPLVVDYSKSSIFQQYYDLLSGCVAVNKKVDERKAYYSKDLGEFVFIPIPKEAFGETWELQLYVDHLKPYIGVDEDDTVYLDDIENKFGMAMSYDELIATSGEGVVVIWEAESGQPYDSLWRGAFSDFKNPNEDTGNLPF